MEKLDTYIELYLNDVDDYGEDNELILAQSVLLRIKSLPIIEKKVIEDLILYIKSIQIWIVENLVKQYVNQHLQLKL